MMLRAAALLAALDAAAGHGSMSTPPPRNMHGLKRDGSDCNPKDYPSNPHACGTACMGEACNWFNDGCVVGCDRCSNGGGSTAADVGCTVNGVPSTDPPMPPVTLAHELRTYDLHGRSIKNVTKNHPWLAPGHSPQTNP